MRYRWASALLLILASGACSTPPTELQVADSVGVFVEGLCPVPLPEGLVAGESIRCGTVAVPEFHRQPDGKRLHLQVAVFPSQGEDPSPAPLFVATAGPGASGIESITPEVAGPLGAALLAERDLVLIDYRGLPLAEPNLMCPEIIEAAIQNLEQPQTAEEFMAGQLEMAGTCRERLIEQGVTLQAYNNVETAADIAMVMTALGYDQFNIYGTSAGTILVQHLLRDHPHRLRSVIIDSTVPAGRSNVHPEAPAIAATSLDGIIQRCEEDPSCSAAFPDLREEASTVIEMYDLEPATVAIMNPATGEPMDMILTGHRVAQGILMLSSQTPTVSLVPLFIHKLAIGETDFVKDFLWAVGPPVGHFSWALGTTIFCLEYSGFTEEEIVFPGINPAYEKAVATQSFGGTTIARTCEMWGLQPIEARFKRPVDSDIPVLLMAGTLDSLTPPRWAHEVAETLANATVIEIEGYAHSPTFAGECPARVALQFLHDPTAPLDTTCLADLELEFAITE